MSVIDGTHEWVAYMKKLFDFNMLKNLIKRDDFHMVFDAMHGVSGPYATAMFAEFEDFEQLRCNSLPDFGGCHPDPNLTYARDLAVKCGYFGGESHYDFGAACDGDADRAMFLGKGFFVSPSDSIAVIAANHKCIPYMAHGISGAARSMPTSGALDNVGKALGMEVFETPTGWKFFGNLLDAERIQLCGEESFGAGSSHVREKDGLWAVLCWL